MTAATLRPGRPRDADVDRRIIESARSVYGERGWSGFNFRAVALHAGVSKDALYRRFESRAALLLAALTVPVARIDFEQYPDLRERLITLAKDTLAWWSEPDGIITFRLVVDSASIPEIRDIYYHNVLKPHRAYLRDWIQSVITRGRLTEIRDPTAFIDALMGGMMMRLVTTLPELRGQMATESDTYVRDLVDLLLAGADYSEVDA
ncbi:TetR/AcrR family transcriptional regulator [Nocardia sp. NBC_01377]|uniref:TetR/AcrR family transcriptional regulator n=1 Tax=Nocardia sp. NBC_01377 TaxID=2903595 RepID=UPI0032462E85